MNRSVYRSIREGNKIIVHSSGPVAARSSDGNKVRKASHTENDTSSSIASTDKKSSNAAKYYTIKKGDNLGSIARRHNTTVKKLCGLNGITANTTLKIGRNIRVR